MWALQDGQQAHSMWAAGNQTGRWRAIALTVSHQNLRSGIYIAYMACSWPAPCRRAPPRREKNHRVSSVGPRRIGGSHVRCGHEKYFRRVTHCWATTYLRWRIGRVRIHPVLTVHFAGATCGETLLDCRRVMAWSRSTMRARL